METYHMEVQAMRENNDEQLGGQNGGQMASGYQFDKNFDIPDIFDWDFDHPGLEKPWQEKGKQEDYFNYGM